MSEVMCYAALLFGNTRVVQIQRIHQFGTYSSSSSLVCLLPHSDLQFGQCQPESHVISQGRQASLAFTTLVMVVEVRRSSTSSFGSVCSSILSWRITKF